MKYFVYHKVDNTDRPTLITDGGTGSFNYNGQRYSEHPLNTFEEAQAYVKARAAAMDSPESHYFIQCGVSAKGLHTGCPTATPAPDTANPKQAFGDKKLPVALVPPSLQLEASLNMGDGAEKYGPYNWRHKKVEVMTYIAAMIRHLASYLDGEDVDPESKRGATHLGAIAACVAIITDARNMGNLIDNRPPRGQAGPVIRKAAGVVIGVAKDVPVKDEIK